MTLGELIGSVQPTPAAMSTRPEFCGDPAAESMLATATINRNTSGFSQCAPNAPAAGSVSFPHPPSTPSKAVARRSSWLIALAARRFDNGQLFVMGVTAIMSTDFRRHAGPGSAFADGETSKISVCLIDDNVSEVF